MTLQSKVMEILETHQIPYFLLPHDEPVFIVEAAAQQRRVVIEEIVKSSLWKQADRRSGVPCARTASPVSNGAVHFQQLHLGVRREKRDVISDVPKMLAHCFFVNPRGCVNCKERPPRLGRDACALVGAVKHA